MKFVSTFPPFPRLASARYPCREAHLRALYLGGCIEVVSINHQLFGITHSVEWPNGSSWATARRLWTRNSVSYPKNPNGLTATARGCWLQRVLGPFSIRVARARASRLRLHSGLHIGIRCTDQPRESHCIAITSRTKLHVAHKLAGTFQNTFRVGNLSASKESDIHVSPKGIDVSKCRVSDACRRMTIVQALSYVVPALTHGLKPIPGNFAQFARMLPQPCIDGCISPGRIGESKELAHIRTWTWPNAPRSATRRTECVNCNRSAMAGFAALCQ